MVKRHTAMSIVGAIYAERGSVIAAGGTATTDTDAYLKRVICTLCYD